MSILGKPRFLIRHSPNLVYQRSQISALVSSTICSRMVLQDQMTIKFVRIFFFHTLTDTFQSRRRIITMAPERNRGNRRCRRCLGNPLMNHCEHTKAGREYLVCTQSSFFLGGLMASAGNDGIASGSCYNPICNRFGGNYPTSQQVNSGTSQVRVSRICQ